MDLQIELFDPEWPIWIPAAFIILLVAISAFFSAGETSLSAASRPRIHQLAKQGNKRASTVNSLLNNTEHLVGAMLLGNNVVNILASAIATGLLIAVFGEAGIFYATVIMTMLVVVFAEVAPKVYALHNADRVALKFAPALRAAGFVLGPPTRAIQFLVRSVFRLLGMRVRSEDRARVREEELRGAIDLHAGPAREVREERRMLRSILDLADVEVGKIMTHRSNVAMVDADEPTMAIVDQVLASQFSRIPVWRSEPDNVIGVLHAKGLLAEMRNHAGAVGKIDIAAVIAKPWFIPDTTALLDQLLAFRQRREHFAIVVDEYGSLKGIVTLEDILEEIVGEIDDESDQRVAGARAQADGSFIIDGTVTIRDLNRELDWHLPDGDAATLAGMILHEARQIPVIGQEFSFYGFRFRILRRQRNRITAVRVVPPRSSAGAAKPS
ncbi:MAG: HlyC/CorC family transporter [Alphaproteobacteria bacterium]|nr:HlyC/CorC family transporter [Alphaproteobacteria bacterium]